MVDVSGCWRKTSRTDGRGGFNLLVDGPMSMVVETRTLYRDCGTEAGVYCEFRIVSTRRYPIILLLRIRDWTTMIIVRLELNASRYLCGAIDDYTSEVEYMSYPIPL